MKSGLDAMPLFLLDNLLCLFLIKGHFHIPFKIFCHFLAKIWFFWRGSSCRSCYGLIPMFHVKCFLLALAKTHILGNFIAGWSEHWNSTFIRTRISIEVITGSWNKIKLIITKKIVKLNYHTNAYNSLTNFEYEVNETTGNGNCENLLNLAWKNLWNRFMWSEHWNSTFIRTRITIEVITGSCWNKINNS